MLKISKLSDYATIILSYLARSEFKQVSQSASQVAEALRIPLPTASKILKLLNEAALVISTRGVMGGYRLSRTAEAISLAEIIAAIEGKPAITECNKGHNICERDGECHIRPHWQRVNFMIFNLLDNVKLNEMM